MKSILIALIIIVLPFSAHSQLQSVNQSYNSLANELTKKQSNSDAESFGGYFSSVIQFAGSSGNTITFQPRIFDLDTIFFSKAANIDSNYTKKTWERSLQTNIGFTPNTKALFDKPSNFQFGINYAFQSNKEIPLSAMQHFFDFQDFLTDWMENSAASDTLKKLIRGIINHGDFSNLPKSLQDEVQKQFGMSIDDLMKIPQHLVDSLSKVLQRRPQLILGVNATDGLGNDSQYGLDVKGSFSSYIFSNVDSVWDPEISVSASYSPTDDTTRSKLNLDRNLLEVAGNLNMIFYSKFELDPGVSYTNIISGLYKKENRSKISLPVELNVKIAEKLVVALNWSYDFQAKTSSSGLKFQTSLQ